MLLNKRELDAIKNGTLTVLFRRWRRASVKTGGTLRTAIGVVRFIRVEAIDPDRVREIEVKAAGFASRRAMLESLDNRAGELYRIELAHDGPDPRLNLREDTHIDGGVFEELRAKLDRLDARSSVGPWTRRVLREIEQRPNVPAREIAASTGYDKDWLKLNIRKLKNLGLTISHHPGYELSPRGKAVVQRLRQTR